MAIETEKVGVKLPSGEEVDVIVPKGASDDDVRKMLTDRGIIERERGLGEKSARVFNQTVSGLMQGGLEVARTPMELLRQGAKNLPQIPGVNAGPVNLEEAMAYPSEKIKEVKGFLQHMAGGEPEGIIEGIGNVGGKVVGSGLVLGKIAKIAQGTPEFAKNVPLFAKAATSLPKETLWTLVPMAEFMAFPDEQTLSTWLNSFPKLEPFVLDYLESKPGDTEMETRLKNAIEGTGLTMLTAGIFKSLQGMKAGGKVTRQKLKARSVRKAKEAAQKEIDEFKRIRDDIQGLEVKDLPVEEIEIKGIPEPSLSKMDTAEALEAEVRGDTLRLSVKELEKLWGGQVPKPKAMRANEGARLDSLKKSIEKKGLEKPIELEVYKTKGGIEKIRIADGHHRIAALKEMGEETIPIKLPEDYFSSGAHPKLLAMVKPKPPKTITSAGPIGKQAGAVDFSIADTIGEIYTKVQGNRKNFAKALHDSFPSTKFSERQIDFLYATAKGAVEKKDVLGKEMLQEAAGLGESMLKEYQEARVADIEDIHKFAPKTVSSQEDISAMLKAYAEKNIIKKKITFEETKVAAARIGMSDKEIARLSAQSNDFHTKVLAAGDYLQVLTKNMVDMAERATASGKQEDLALFGEMLMQHGSVVDDVFNIYGNYGRALNSMKILKDAGRVQESYRKALDSLGGAGTLKEFADAIIAMKGTPEELSKFLSRKLRKPTLADAFLEMYINGLLSAPKTHATNAMSTALATMWQIPERYLAASIGKLHGGDKVFFNEANRFAYGWTKGWKDGLVAFSKTWQSEDAIIKYGKNTYEDLIGKIELERHRAITSELLPESWRGTATADAVDVFGDVIRIPGRTLYAGDALLKTVVFRQSIEEQAAIALNRAMKEGRVKKGQEATFMIDYLANPPKEAISTGITEARYATFTKPLGSRGRAIQHATGHPAVRMIVPFIRTPINIMKFAIERTPAAPILGEWRDMIKAGGRTRDIALARLTMGSGMAAVITDYATQGYFTGSAPIEPDARNMFFEAGNLEYSFVDKDGIFGERGRNYSLSRMEPIGTIIGLASDYSQIRPYLSDEEAEHVGAMIVAAISKNLTNKTYMRSFTDMMLAFNDPERYGYKLKNYISTTTTPRIVAEAAREIDPTVRRAREAMDVYKASIPGYSKEVPPRRNLMGDPVLRPKGWGIGWLNPITTQNPKQDPVIEEMFRNGITLQRVREKIDGVELTPWQYDELQRYVGHYAKSQMNRLINSRTWEKASPLMKQKLATKVYSISKRAGSLKFRQDYPEVMKKWRDLKKEELDELRGIQ